ncbi:MAG: carboxylating nicotinate-nucleotide diphosphorylase [Thermoleophilaceae bacterium]|nr:carboxylating nicotinate-nucleotide diphosphorylase [Actinomycetota bacterium]
MADPLTREIHEVVARALAEDLGAGDLTTAAVVPAGALAVARIEQRAAGVLSGLDAACEVFAQTGPELRFEALAEDGAWREPGDVAVIEGDAAAILAGERVALNLLGRLSGVATMTASYVRAVDGTGARILDTRKTTPGLRRLEKRAVIHGGGVSHRAGLYDAILVKENHALLAGGVGEAARLALADSAGAAFVESEVESLDDLDEVLAAGVGRVLLDNMDVAELREAVERARATGASLEASGGISLDTVRAVAETGVDFISVGALTHSAPALDVSLLLEPA